jgi:hypothetical protein
MKPNSTPTYRCQITERDYKLLRFLWKWKTVSTTGLARKFFPEIQPLSAYRRLMHLEAGGFVRSLPIDGRWNEVWGLTDRGFKYILPKLGELQHVGHKSENVFHDYLSSAFHLGEWLTHQPENSQTYSEQQLRRYPTDAWPPHGFHAQSATGPMVTRPSSVIHTELSSRLKLNSRPRRRAVTRALLPTTIARRPFSSSSGSLIRK